MKKLISLIIVAVIVLSFVSCGQKETSQLKSVDVVLDWLPNTNHTGLYTALERGYYADEGLQVNIITPAADTALEAVSVSKAQFGIGYQEQVTQARTANAPLDVVAIAAIIAHNTSGFAAPKDKGIKSVADFAGKRYGGFGTPLEQAFITYLCEKNGVDPSSVIYENDASFNFLVSTQTRVDFSWIFHGWDGIIAQQKGVELDFMLLQDLDPVFDFYTPVIVTSGEMIESDPDTVAAFMRATYKGYVDCVNEPDACVEYFLKYSPETDPETARVSQQYLAEQYISDSPKWGYMKAETWQNFGDFMYNSGIIDKPFDGRAAFTNQFLPE